jgi:hypothetical protein
MQDPRLQQVVSLHTCHSRLTRHIRTQATHRPWHRTGLVRVLDSVVPVPFIYLSGRCCWQATNNFHLHRIPLEQQLPLLPPRRY